MAEMRELCCACLVWLCGLLVGPFISLTNAHAGCGRPTLNFLERLFWLGSVRSDSEAMFKAMNKAMNKALNCIITMQIITCTEMYTKPDVQKVDVLRPEPERSGVRHRDENLNADVSETILQRIHRLMKGAITSTGELFSMKVNLKVF